jgi:hypothetical protein
MKRMMLGFSNWDGGKAHSQLDRLELKLGLLTCPISGSGLKDPPTETQSVKTPFGNPRKVKVSKGK